MADDNQAINLDVPGQPSGWGDYQQLPEAPVPPATLGGRLGDFAIDVGKALVDIPGGIAGARPTLPGTPESTHSRRESQEFYADVAPRLEGLRSEHGAAVQARGGPSIGDNTIDAISQTVAGVVGSAPALLTGPLAPGVFAAQSYGGLRNQMSEAIRFASEKELMDSPVYRDARRAGQSDSAARQALYEATNDALSGGIAAASGAVGGGLLQKLAGRMGNRLIARALGDRIMEKTGQGLIRRLGTGAVEGYGAGAIMGGGSEWARQRALEKTGMGPEVDPRSILRTAHEQGLQLGIVGGATKGVMGQRPTVMTGVREGRWVLNGRPSTEAEVKARAPEIWERYREKPEEAEAPPADPVGTDVDYTVARQVNEDQPPYMPKQPTEPPGPGYGEYEEQQQPQRAPPGPPVDPNAQPWMPPQGEPRPGVVPPYMPPGSAPIRPPEMVPEDIGRPPPTGETRPRPRGMIPEDIGMMPSAEPPPPRARPDIPEMTEADLGVRPPRRAPAGPVREMEPTDVYEPGSPAHYEAQTQELIDQMNALKTEREVAQLDVADYTDTLKRREAKKLDTAKSQASLKQAQAVYDRLDGQIRKLRAEIIKRRSGRPWRQAAPEEYERWQEPQVAPPERPEREGAHLPERAEEEPPGWREYVEQQRPGEEPPEEPPPGGPPKGKPPTGGGPPSGGGQVINLRDRLQAQYDHAKAMADGFEKKRDDALAKGQKGFARIYEREMGKWEDVERRLGAKLDEMEGKRADPASSKKSPKQIVDEANRLLEEAKKFTKDIAGVRELPGEEVDRTEHDAAKDEVKRWTDAMDERATDTESTPQDRERAERAGDFFEQFGEDMDWWQGLIERLARGDDFKRPADSYEAKYFAQDIEKLRDISERAKQGGDPGLDRAVAHAERLLKEGTEGKAPVTAESKKPVGPMIRVGAKGSEVLRRLRVSPKKVRVEGKGGLALEPPERAAEQDVQQKLTFKGKTLPTPRGPAFTHQRKTSVGEEGGPRTVTALKSTEVRRGGRWVRPSAAKSERQKLLAKMAEERAAEGAPPIRGETVDTTQLRLRETGREQRRKWRRGEEERALARQAKVDDILDTMVKGLEDAAAEKTRLKEWAANAARLIARVQEMVRASYEVVFPGEPVEKPGRIAKPPEKVSSGGNYVDNDGQHWIIDVGEVPGQEPKLGQMRLRPLPGELGQKPKTMTAAQWLAHKAEQMKGLAKRERQKMLKRKQAAYQYNQREGVAEFAAKDSEFTIGIDQLGKLITEGFTPKFKEGDWGKYDPKGKRGVRFLDGLGKLGEEYGGDPDALPLKDKMRLFRVVIDKENQEDLVKLANQLVDNVRAREQAAAEGYKALVEKWKEQGPYPRVIRMNLSDRSGVGTWHNRVAHDYPAFRKKVERAIRSRNWDALRTEITDYYNEELAVQHGGIGELAAWRMEQLRSAQNQIQSAIAARGKNKKLGGVDRDWLIEQDREITKALENAFEDDDLSHLQREGTTEADLLDVLQTHPEYRSEAEVTEEMRGERERRGLTTSFWRERVYMGKQGRGMIDPYRISNALDIARGALNLLMPGKSDTIGSQYTSHIQQEHIENWIDRQRKSAMIDADRDPAKETWARLGREQAEDRERLYYGEEAVRQWNQFNIQRFGKGWSELPDEYKQLTLLKGSLHTPEMTAAAERASAGAQYEEGVRRRLSEEEMVRLGPERARLEMERRANLPEMALGDITLPVEEQVAFIHRLMNGEGSELDVARYTELLHNRMLRLRDAVMSLNPWAFKDPEVAWRSDEALRRLHDEMRSRAGEPSERDVTPETVTRDLKRWDMEAERIEDNLRKLWELRNPDVKLPEYGLSNMLDPAVNIRAEGAVPRGAFATNVGDHLTPHHFWGVGEVSGIRRHFLDVAQRLVGHLDLVHVSFEHMKMLAAERGLKEIPPAFYDPATDRIFIQHDAMQARNRNRVLMHELAHPIMESAAQKFPVIRARLEEQMAALKEAFNNPEHPQHKIVNRLLDGDSQGLNNVHEFFSELWSNDNFAQALHEVRTSAAQRARWQTGKRATVLDAVLKQIKRGLTGMFFTVSRNRLLNDATVASLDILQRLEERGRTRPYITEETAPGPIAKEPPQRSVVRRATEATLDKMSTAGASINKVGFFRFLAEQSRRFDPVLAEHIDRIIDILGRVQNRQERIARADKPVLMMLRDVLHKGDPRPKDEPVLNYVDKENYAKLVGEDRPYQGQNKWMDRDNPVHRQAELRWADLNKDWQKLSPEDQKAVKVLRKVLMDRHENVLNAVLQGLAGRSKWLEKGEPGAVEAVKKTIRGETLTPEDTRAFDADFAGTPQARPEFDKQVAEWRRIPYFRKLEGVFYPMMRHGDFLVSGHYDLEGIINEHNKANPGDQIRMSIASDRPEGLQRIEFSNEAQRDRMVRFLAEHPDYDFNITSGGKDYLYINHEHFSGHETER